MPSQRWLLTSQGRFSGRLKLKADEKVLMDRCRQLGPLLGGCPGTGGDSLSHLSAIVRGVASGQVYRMLHEREELIMVRVTYSFDRCIMLGMVHLSYCEFKVFVCTGNELSHAAFVGNMACPPCSSSHVQPKTIDDCPARNIVCRNVLTTVISVRLMCICLSVWMCQ